MDTNANINLVINENQLKDLGENIKDYSQYMVMKSIIVRNLLNDMYLNKKSKTYITEPNNQRIFFFILRQINYLNVPKKDISNFIEYTHEK
jgi:hypothetical protein